MNIVWFILLVSISAQIIELNCPDVSSALTMTTTKDIDTTSTTTSGLITTTTTTKGTVTQTTTIIFN